MVSHGLFGSGLAFQQADPRIEFWRRPELWPDDSKDFIFAARAIQEWGNSLGPQNWSPDAPLTVLTPPLPRRLDLWTPLEEIRRGVGILNGLIGTNAGGLAGLGGLLPPAGSGEAGGSPFPIAEEWAEAVKISDAAWDRAWSKFRPFLTLAMRLAGACKSGDVKTASRPLKGGAFTLYDWDMWNTERAWQRFDTCRIDLNDPFDLRLCANGGAWIYIDRATFEAYKKGEPVQPRPPAAEDGVIKEQIRTARRAGRPPRYDWDPYAARFSRMVKDETVDADRSTADITRELLEWGAERFEETPDDKTMQTKVAVWRSQLEGSG